MRVANEPGLRQQVVFTGAALAVVVLTACGTLGDQPDEPGDTDWPAYGGDPGGSGYAALRQIDADNEHRLEQAWSFSTGDVSHDPENEMEGECGNCHTGDIKFESTPIVVGGRMFVSTPLNRVVALDPGSGEELWRGGLPAGGQATPMTYMHEGRQYVVIAAGGHGSLGTTRGDHVVAFALPGG